MSTSEPDAAVARAARTACAAAAVVVLGAGLRSQSMTWRVVDDAQILGNGVYDVRRERLVVFGLQGETWEYDGAHRLHRAPLGGGPSPGARSQQAMAYDAYRGHVLMFGGRTANGTALADTWAWDGRRWRQLSSPAAPPQRGLASAAFDLLRGVVVLTGGFDGRTLQTDTWEHDGTNWIARTPTATPWTAPLADVRAAMSFDAARGVIVLMWGDVNRPTTPVETWEYDGINWTLRAQTIGLGLPACAAYDAPRQRTVLLGGMTALQTSNTISEWDGTAWRIAGTLPGVAGTGEVAWYDAARASVLFAGGPAGDLGTVAWNGAATAALQPPSAPTQRAGNTWTMAQGGRLLAFGSADPFAPAETWMTDGASWTLAQPAATPPSRGFAAAALDESTSDVVLFGGRAASTTRSDFWAFDGTNWRSLPTTGGPTARTLAAMTWDAARNVVVMFGGEDLNGALLDEFWEWNGTWTLRLGGTRPARRSQAGIACDRARGRILIAGGFGGGATPLVDAWEWNGSVFTPIASVPAGTRHSLCWDGNRQRVVVGVWDTVRTSFLAFDGSAWQLLGTLPGAALQVVFEPRRARLVAYDGSHVFEEDRGTAASASTFGNSCGGRAGIAALSRPRIGDREFGYELDALPGSPALFAVGLTQANVPLPGGCQALVGPVLASAFALAGGNGLATVRLPLPLTPQLRGLAVLVQAGALDPAQGTLSTSEGLRLVLGD